VPGVAGGFCAGRRAVFNFVREPSQEQIARVVPIAVKVFLAAYRAPRGHALT